MSDDLRRYHEYLQSQLLSAGWNDWFTGEGRERRFDADGMAKMAERHGLDGAKLRELVQRQVGFQPNTKFDQPDIPLIYQPLLDRIHAAARKTKWAVTAPITIATSTDASPTPFARPNEAGHTLFIGIGTGKFCNCWAKAFTNLALAVWKDDPDTNVPKIRQLVKPIQDNPQFVSFSFYLAYNYALIGNVANVEQEIPANQQEASLKAYLLDAMELFVVGHEYAHFVAEERCPEFKGILDPDRSMELEAFCDALGLFLAQAAATDPWNQIAFSGAGGLLFLRSLQLCEYARSLVQPPTPSASHPASLERVTAIVEQIRSMKPPAMREPCLKILKGYDMIALGQSGWLVPMLHWAIKGRLPTLKELDPGPARA